MNYSTVNFSSDVFADSTHNVEWAITPLDICVYIISVLLGFPTHFYVIRLIVTGTGSGVALEFFILNLSVCEIGNCVNSLLSIFDTLTPSIKTLAYFLLGLSITGRPLFQCLICVERYLAVLHPVIFLKYKPLRYRLICCVFAWIITIVCCLYCMFTISYFDNTYFIYLYWIHFLFFLSVQLFCLVSVLRALKQSGPGDRRREEENHMKRRAFYVILITTVTMFVMYIPFIVTGFFFILTHEFILYLFSFGFLCFVLGSFVQPLLYLHRAGKLSHFCST